MQVKWNFHQNTSQVPTVQGLFHALLGYSKMRNTWKIPQKYQLNSSSKTFHIAFWLEFHQNTTKIPSKYHLNSRKHHKNSIRIPFVSTKKLVVFHRNNSGKHVVTLDKIGGSIPTVFQWNSIKIPLQFQMLTSGMPAEFPWNSALKFQHLF